MWTEDIDQRFSANQVVSALERLLAELNNGAPSMDSPDSRTTSRVMSGDTSYGTHFDGDDEDNGDGEQGGGGASIMNPIYGMMRAVSVRLQGGVSATASGSNSPTANNNSNNGSNNTHNNNSGAIAAESSGGDVSPINSTSRQISSGSSNGISAPPIRRGSTLTKSTSGTTLVASAYDASCGSAPGSPLRSIQKSTEKSGALSEKTAVSDGAVVAVEREMIQGDIQHDTKEETKIESKETQETEEKTVNAGEE